MLLLFLLLLFLCYLTFVSFWGLFDPPYFLLFFFSSRAACVCACTACVRCLARVCACVCVCVCMSFCGSFVRHLRLVCLRLPVARAHAACVFLAALLSLRERGPQQPNGGGVMFRRGQGRGAGRESMIVLSVSRVLVMGLFGDSTIVRSVCFRVLLPRGGWRGGGGPLASPGPVF